METRNNARPFGYPVLLVDDDVDDQYLFSSLMQDMHLHLQVFTSGFNALSYLFSLSREEHPSVIVLDYHMPGIDGLELLTRLKTSRRLSHIPVVVYSSDMSARLAETFKRAGAVGCFQKSGNMEELKEFLLILGVVIENSVFE